jgi:hypothetical protein
LKCFGEDGLMANIEIYEYPDIDFTHMIFASDHPEKANIIWVKSMSGYSYISILAINPSSPKHFKPSTV